MRLNQVTVRVMDINRAFEFYKALGLIPIVAGTDHYARFLCPVGDSTFSIELSRGETPHSTTTDRPKLALARSLPQRPGGQYRLFVLCG